jgi:hypothetical protein
MSFGDFFTHLWYLVRYGSTHPVWNIIETCKLHIEQDRFDEAHHQMRLHRNVLGFNDSFDGPIWAYLIENNDLKLFECAVEAFLLRLHHVATNNSENLHKLIGKYGISAFFWGSGGAAYSFSWCFSELTSNDLTRLLWLLRLDNFVEQVNNGLPRQLSLNLCTMDIDRLRLSLSAGIFFDVHVCERCLHGYPSVESNSAKCAALCFSAFLEQSNFLQKRQQLDERFGRIHFSFNSDQLEQERRKISNISFLLIEKEAIEIAIAFCHLPALVTVQIVENLLHAELVPFYCKWNLVTNVKHCKK